MDGARAPRLQAPRHRIHRGLRQRLQPANSCAVEVGACFLLGEETYPPAGRRQCVRLEYDTYLFWTMDTFLLSRICVLFVLSATDQKTIEFSCTGWVSLRSPSSSWGEEDVLLEETGLLVCMIYLCYPGQSQEARKTSDSPTGDQTNVSSLMACLVRRQGFVPLAGLVS